MLRYGPVEEVEEVVIEEESTDVDLESRLVVYNDDVNTFDWVIKCFMEVLDHTHEQAVQLSLIIHFKWHATVTTAPLEELKP